MALMLNATQVTYFLPGELSFFSSSWRRDLSRTFLMRQNFGNWQYKMTTPFLMYQLCGLQHISIFHTSTAHVAQSRPGATN